MTFRDRLSLDGPWQFQIDPADKFEDNLDGITTWREASVPLPWQAQFDDLRHYSGVAWYRRQFILDPLPSGSAILHFGAVDYQATVWLNGHPLGEHEGGYLPFEFEVAPHLKSGDNTLVVRVVDPNDGPDRWPDFPFGQIPHGKQSWYGPIGGIWQSVWLEQRAEYHLRSLRLTPNPADGTVSITANLNQSPESSFEIRGQVFDPGGSEVARAPLDHAGKGQAQLDQVTLDLWSPDNPALYTVTATLFLADEPVDRLSDTCGFRTVEARDGRIYLNDEPVYLRGALDQAYYPETIYTPPSLEFLEDQAGKAKALGLNCLRCHIKIEDPRYYEVADRLGLLIWTEIPNWAWLTPRAAERAKETFRQMVERDWNHPSIIAWSLVNENWGTDLAHNADHRRWLADFTAEAKSIDPTRLVVDNSACRGNRHVAGDIEDFHHYRAIPDHAAEWDAWVADFAGRADWVWAEDYAETRRADLPLLVSEFGNWGLPHPDNIEEQGAEPWWFETGFEWGDGIVYPHGIQERFKFWGLGNVFGSFDHFIAAHDRHMALSLAYEIATMRRHESIAGYVITEFTDVHWECNGLLDMQRNVKRHLGDFVAVNQDQVVVIRPQGWSGRPGETLPVEIQAFDVDGAGSEGTLHWQAGAAEGALDAPGGLVDIPLPDAPANGLLPIIVQWQSENGEPVAQNQVEVAWTTPPVGEQPVCVIDDPALAEVLAGLGYPVTEDVTAEDGVLIARTYTHDLRQLLQNGRPLLLLAGPEMAQAAEAISLPVGQVVPRAGTVWQGDWATAFSWLKKHGPLAHLPGGPLLEMEYAGIVPETVLTGLRPWIAAEHSWAGLAVGWIHKPVSLLARIPYGQSHIVVSTFNLTADRLADHAIGQSLLAGMINLAGGSTLYRDK